MIERLGPLILLSTLTVGLPKGYDQIPLTMVKPGDNFTMTCPIDRAEAGLLYWYRMSFEPVIETIAKGSYDSVKLEENFNNHRFSVIKVHRNLFSLNIINVTKQDEASYFCQAGSSYKMTFFNATFLMVLDQGNHSFYVDQSRSASAPLGESVQLNCSLLSKRDSSVQCPSKRSVHWFRSGSGSSPANVLYTYRHEAEDQDQRTRVYRHQAEDQDQRTCVYSLTTALQDLNDTGTYYCAVATCGLILFGNGTKVEIDSTLNWLPVCAVLGVLLLCSAVVNAVMFYQCRKAAHYKEAMTTHCSTDVLATTADQSNTEVDDECYSSVNYAVLDFPLRKQNRKNALPPECLYSATRQYR